AAGLTALGYGLCTIAWVYARMFWELTILGLCYLIAIWAVRRATESEPLRRWPWLLLCGSAMAVGLTLRFESAVTILFVGLYLIAKTKPATGSASPSSRFIHRLLAAGPTLGLYLLPTLFIALGLATFNLVRYGSLAETGYTQEILFLEPWVGGYGLLFSPGQGLFIYAPLMLLLFFGLRPAWRRLSRTTFWLITAICLFYWLFYGSWFAWGGTWGWGPRFFLPMLPIMMLFVAEPLEGLLHAGPGLTKVARYTAWLGIGLLVLLSLTVNILGIVVDFNEHFLRLGRNDNFVFNWAAIPLLGHWRILQDGLVDLIWLRPGPNGLTIAWSILVPGLILLMFTSGGLIITFKDLAREHQVSNHGSRFIFHPAGLALMSLLTLALTYLTLMATARVALEEEQTQADLPLLETVAAQASPGDALLIPMPPYGDVKELAIRTMDQLDQPIPTFAWIENEPRAILPEERDHVRQATYAGAERVWLFERWLTQNDPLGPTAARLNREAFQIQEQWFDQSGKLSLYALVDDDVRPSVSLALDIPFEGGIRLVDFSLFGNELVPGDIANVRLTWQAPEVDQLKAEALPQGSVVVFLHLLAESPAAQPITQLDRLLLELQQVERSTLLPGQTVSQGYGLRLPDDLVPGSYPLITGLYIANTGQRLHRTDDSPDDFLYLTNLTVQLNQPSLAQR
ncbi:MAG TPA: hypothetical protein VGD99_11780, partial [Anaerolineae bacterium]